MRWQRPPTPREKPWWQWQWKEPWLLWQIWSQGPGCAWHSSTSGKEGERVRAAPRVRGSSGMGRAGDGGGMAGVAAGLGEAGTPRHLQCLQPRSCGPATACPQGCQVADAASLHQLLHSRSLSILPPTFWVGRDQGCEHNRAPQETASLLPGQHGCAWQWPVGGHRGRPAPPPAGTHPGTGWQQDQGGGSPGGSGRHVPQGCWCRAGCSCASPGHTRRCLVVGKRAAQGYGTRREGGMAMLLLHGQGCLLHPIPSSAAHLALLPGLGSDRVAQGHHAPSS